jgi:hypothetical protein
VACASALFPIPVPLRFCSLVAASPCRDVGLRLEAMSEAELAGLYAGLLRLAALEPGHLERLLSTHP